uniref:G-protein coupled receptors family 2 profile 2 domain-containing protein n=1 Tax=Heliothis virescens TaxID=7102 RepID=A0A2A4JF49_HELVI
MFRVPVGSENDGVVKPYFWQDYEDVDDLSEFNYVEYDNVDDTPEINEQIYIKNDENIDLNTHMEDYQLINDHYHLHKNNRSLCPKNKTCARKCCPLGWGFNETAHTCTPLSDVFNPSIWKRHKMMKESKATDELHFLFGHVICTSYHAIKPTTSIRLQSDGTLMVERTSGMGPGLVFQINQYCMDLFITEDNEIELNAHICYIRNEPRRHFIVVEICLMISCILIILNVIVFALLPVLRPRHRLLIMAYLISFLLSFSVKFFEIFLILWKISYRHMCLYFTFIFYFFFISGFFWRNIMCYDMWWTISSKRSLSGQCSDSRVRLFLYFVYGFGMPGVITGIVATLEFSDIENDHPFMPNIQNEGCNALYGYSKAIYQYGPVCLLFCINLILFGLTILKIKKINKETKKVLRSQDSQTHITKNDKQWMNLSMKIFIVMLIAEVNCIFDFTSRLFPNYQIFCHLADLNILTVPFIVYLNFKCQGQSWKNIKARYKLKKEQAMVSSVRTMSTITQSQDSIGCTTSNNSNFPRSISVISA